MAQTFYDLIEHLLADQTEVSIGSGENELLGTITSFDKAYHVLAFTDQRPDGTIHFIPLTSIRSIGVDKKADRISCYLDLFKR
ncbi:MAG: hypothetical protein JWM44_2903 [Bacilli bacterium]|jgi:hypothetical protein|nr:hypothetical protein [Bacilli bacterium]